MKKSFLSSLVGLEISDATEMVLSEGHIPLVVEEGISAISSIARGNTVVLWEKSGKVSDAEAGDPCQLI